MKHYISVKEYKTAEENARSHIEHITYMAGVIEKILGPEVYGKTKGKFMYTVHSNAVLIELIKLKPQDLTLLEAVRQKQLETFYEE